MSNEQTIPVNLYLEASPNPNTLKFVANFMLTEDGVSYEFRNPEEAQASPLAAEIFAFPFVEGVFISSNFITVSKNASTEWLDVQAEIKDLITSFLKEKRQVIDPEAIASTQKACADDSESVSKIKTILDEYIRPAVEQDGGAITFHSFEQGVVKVVLQGACSGCPSSTITLKAGIETLLKRMLPEVESVEAING
ncbi:MAG: NifU family protein [Cytophagales bacterium]|nr:NifU family protein [Cytophagales bacterium]